MLFNRIKLKIDLVPHFIWTLNVGNLKKMLKYCSFDCKSRCTRWKRKCWIKRGIDFLSFFFLSTMCIAFSFLFRLLMKLTKWKRVTQFGSSHWIWMQLHVQLRNVSTWFELEYKFKWKIVVPRATSEKEENKLQCWFLFFAPLCRLHACAIPVVLFVQFCHAMSKWIRNGSRWNELKRVRKKYPSETQRKRNKMKSKQQNYLMNSLGRTVNCRHCKRIKVLFIAISSSLSPSLSFSLPQTAKCVCACVPAMTAYNSTSCRFSLSFVRR